MGSLLVIVSAIGFGSMALCAKLAYADGVDTHSLLALRFGIAALLLAALSIARRARWPSGRVLRLYLLMGVVYAGMAWAYFSALQHAASSTVAIVLYTYPVLVALAAAALRIDSFGLSELLALIVTSMGLLLVLGGSLEGSWTGFALAFLSGSCYAGYILLGSRIGGNADPIAASTVVLLTAAGIFLVLSNMGGMRLPTSMTGWSAVGGMAFFGSAVAIASFVAGLDRVGPTLAAVLSTAEPVVTVSLGVAFLGERLGSHTAFGGLLILLAALGLATIRARRASAAMRHAVA